MKNKYLGGLTKEQLLKIQEYNILYNQCWNKVNNLIKVHTIEFNEKLEKKNISIIPNINNKEESIYIQHGIGEITREQFLKEMESDEKD